MVLGAEINGFVVVMDGFAKDGDGGYGGFAKVQEDIMWWQWVAYVHDYEP